MAPDLAKLLLPISEEAPAGPDLAYEAERFTIEQAFETSVSIDANGDAGERAEADWPATITLILDQFSRTKDLWLAVYLCRAAAKAGRLETLALGSRLLAGLLETYWDAVHPALAEYGFQGRKGACDTLTTFREFIAPLGALPVIEHPRLGRFDADDLVRFHTGGDREDGYGLFRGLLHEQAGALDELALFVERIDVLVDGLRRADAALVTHAAGATGSNFMAVYQCLAAIRAAVASFLPVEEAETGDADAVEDGGAIAGARLPGGISGRDDVVRALDLVIDYYRAREPASPIPMLIERARAWVHLDFMSVLEDIAPRAMDDASLVLRTRAREGG